jgi:hypothetical protein
MDNEQHTGLSSTAALWASAFVIGALILVQAGRWAGNTARAEMVSQSGDYAMLTTDSGSDELLYVIDNRNEQMFVYRVENQNSVQLYGRESIAQLFTHARARAVGGP